jgi:hypothetical protein
MSKTKTSIYSPDLSSQLINIQNKNNVYDVSSGNFVCDNSNSLFNNRGCLDSYYKENIDATWIKLLDNNKITLKDNILSDENDNSIDVTSARKATEIVFNSSDIIDAFDEYYITTQGVYKNDVLLFKKQLYINKAFIYVINDTYIFILDNYSKTLQCYDSTGTLIRDWSSYVTWTLANEAFVFVDSSASHIFAINDRTEHVLLNTTTDEEPVITTIDSTVDILSNCVTVTAKLGLIFEMNDDHTCNISIDPTTTTVTSTSVETIGLLGYNNQYCVSNISFNYDGTLNVTVNKNTGISGRDIEKVTSSTSTTIVAATTQFGRMDEFCYGYVFVSKQETTDTDKKLFLNFIFSCNGAKAPIFNTNDNSTSGESGMYLGFPVKNYKPLFKQKSDFYYINNTPMYVVYNNVVVPLGFIEKIYSNNNGLTYLSSIDQKVHHVVEEKATDEDIFNIETLDVNIYETTFSNVNTTPTVQNLNAVLRTVNVPTQGAYALLMSWIENSTQYTFVTGNNIIWLPEKCTVVLNMLANMPSLAKTFNAVVDFFSKYFSEIFYGTETLLSCKYQNETTVDLSDVTVSSDIENRVPIPLSSQVKKLTPEKYIGLIGDTWFKLYSYAGQVVPAIDLTSTSLVSSSDVIDNIISLRGNLFTIKNNSIYDVSTDNGSLTLGKYLTSLGRLKYLCSNDSYIFFKDDILNRIMSFDASNSWNIFLDTPEFNIQKGYISPQNECVLYNDTDVLMINGSAMSKFPLDTTKYFSSNGAELAFQNLIYKPVTDNGEQLEFQTSWLGSTQCRQLLQLDTIYFEVESYDNNIKFNINLELLVDSVVKAGTFTLVKSKVSNNLYYFRIQPTAQKCNAFRYNVKCNGAIKRISYSITQDEEIIPMIEPDVVKEVKL